MKVKRALSFVLVMSILISAAVFGAGAAENPQPAESTAPSEKGTVELVETGSDDTVYTSGLF